METIRAIFRFSTWRTFSWRYPEWWSLALSACAWLWMVSSSLSPHHHHLASSLLLDTRNWLLMVVAMMLPLTTESIRVTSSRSLWSRRHRAILGFIVGYLSLWLIAGVLTSMSTMFVSQLGGRSLVFAALAFAMAAIWQLSGYRQRAWMSCHRTMPLAPAGWPAHRDCFCYGWGIGSQCLRTCWFTMAACALTNHSLVLMVCAALVGFRERYTWRPSERSLAMALGMFAAICGVRAIFEL